MKKMKKFLALVTAAAMLVGTMNFGGIAAEDVDYDETVTVTGLAEGDVAHFYKVLAWNGDNPANTVSGWYATTDYASVLTTEVLTDVLVDDSETTAKKDPRGITADLAGDLAKLAGTAVADVTVESDKKAVLDVTGENLGAGMYMVLITPKDMDTVYNPVFVSSDFVEDNDTHTWGVDEAATYSDKAAAKKSTTTLDKEIDKNTEDAWDDGKEQTTAVGDTVSFTVTTTIPAFGEVFDNPSFVVTDKLKDLALVYKSAADIEVTPATYGDDNKATYTATATDGADNYTLTFDKDYLRTITTPQAVTIKYKAIVTTDAAANVNPEDNTIQITYSNNPNDESSKSAKFDETHNYTFTIDASALFGGKDAEGKRGKEIVKVGVDAQGNPIMESKEVVSDITVTNKQVSPLEGAEFKLYTDEACTKEYIPKKKDGTAGTALVIKSDENGLMTIPGLDAGTYYLKETKAPKGFVKDPNAAKIEISATFKKVDITKFWNGSAWSETKANATDIAYTAKDVEILESYKVLVNNSETVHTFMNESTNSDIKWVEESSKELPSSIVNTQGVELPSTGGMGTTLFYVIGAILVLGAGILLVTRRRMSAN